MTMTGNATRQYFYKSFSCFIRFLSSFDGQSYQSAGSSQYSHDLTFGMANYRGKALITGCEWGSCGLKTELMDMNTLTWSSGPDYPYTSE